MSLSFNPSFNSGIPLRKLFIWIEPMISECNTVPLLATSRFTFSITSRKISFFRCLIPSDRHDTALVRAMGGRGAASRRLLSWVTTLHGIDWGHHICIIINHYHQCLTIHPFIHPSIHLHKLVNVLSEYLGLACLRVSEVHRLVQQLVHHHEVITNALLLELSEVVLEHLQSSQCRHEYGW